ncbi:MAG: polyribonucleotide nucleotidyltransferase [Verrucomicrobia bacterium]|nr:polyribonucleotide nucleotidyltransferase [Verrucomicrobiota bacterium]MDA1067526.1 polyribonucleotide nucleotidyltransferase [Verrucomicrobiota bacterium]
MKQKHSVTVDGLGITISTGDIAKQSSGAVTVSLGETTLFVSATVAEELRPDQNWFPLTVDYREKYSAAGRFPGGYFKREGRPSEKEILTSRLCDRPLRPLFPKGFLNEIQVIGILLSTDLVNDADILMVNGASAAILISDIPWNGPVGCIRLAQIDGEFVVNPTNEQQCDSDLDLIYVGTETEMLMIEGSADQIPEARFIEALEYSQKAIQPIIASQRELAKLAGKEKREFALYNVTDENLKIVRDLIGDRLKAAVYTSKKTERRAAVKALKEEAEAALIEANAEGEYDKNQLSIAMEILQEEVYRSGILADKTRADGRAPLDLRKITCDVDILPTVHGSAMFSRGETQTLGLLTLGGMSDAQSLDAITGGSKEKSFILHYNFPPYSVGETGRFGIPGRREIGHGALAERSLLPVIPAEEEFPYSVRIVSEIMESNGSTSMASVCAGCLALMDAGVPIIAPVAGISTGLVTEKNEAGEYTKKIVLVDIIGDEDHFGDMDFKICGTREGITGFQLDLKINGLPHDTMVEAVKESFDARMKILDAMAEAMPQARAEVKENAPRIQTIQIDPEKIGLLIGPGGKNIRRMTEVSGANIEIDSDNSGKVYIYSNNKQSLEIAFNEIKMLTAEIEVGAIYRGTVKSVKDFGVFVEALPGKEGLVHISELADFRVNKTEDVAKLGDEIWVKCIGIDDKGRVKLSRKAAMAEREAASEEPAGVAAEDESENS